MNIKSLRAFVLVVEEGSLVAASGKMALSQPAVSRLINLLEADVGARLFFRDQRNLVPTPEAELFYPEARRVVSSVEEFPKLFRELRNRRLVPLRIVSQERWTNGLVIPALIEFANRRPEIRFTLDIHPRREIGRRLNEERFDLCIYVAPLQVRGVRLVEDHPFRLQVLLPRNHPLTGHASLSCKDLEGVNYIALKRGLMAREAIEAALAKSGETLEVFCEVSSSNAAHRLVVGGLGFTFSDSSIPVHAFREQTALVPWDTEVGLRVGIYEMENQPRHEAVSDFLDCLRHPLNAI